MTPSPDAAQNASTSVAPTTEYTLPPDKLAKSKALYDLSGKLRIIGTVWGFVVLLGILYFGVIARYRDWAERAAKNRFVQALIVVPLFLLTLDILDWPLGAYSHHVSLQYGLSVQHWGSWLADLLKGEAISIFVSIFALWLLIWLIRKSPRRWWFYFWLIALP
ncbi:MAG: M48 family metallopeptidase, partial [Candidatus Angelobacter sp.]